MNSELPSAGRELHQESYALILTHSNYKKRKHRHKSISSWALGCITKGKPHPSLFKFSLTFHSANGTLAQSSLSVQKFLQWTFSIFKVQVLCFAPAKSLRPPQMSWWDCLLVPKWTGIRFVEKGSSSRLMVEMCEWTHWPSTTEGPVDGPKTNLHLVRKLKLLYGTIKCSIGNSVPHRIPFSSHWQPLVFKTANGFYLERLSWWLSCPRCRIGVKSSELFYLFFIF